MEKKHQHASPGALEAVHLCFASSTQFQSARPTETHCGERLAWGSAGRQILTDKSLLASILTRCFTLARSGMVGASRIARLQGALDRRLFAGFTLIDYFIRKKEVMSPRFSDSAKCAL